jgi:Ca2+-binding EF-hand superfamily protein
MLARGVVAFLLLGSAVLAAPRLPDAAQVVAALRAIDTTGNNAISQDEWRDASFALFRATDKNNNDFIETEELKASELAQDTFRRLDADQDGRLSVDEFMRLRRQIFAIADFNQDTYVTLLEFELLVIYEAVGWQEPGETPQLPFSQLQTVLGKLFAQLDHNSDGQLEPADVSFMQPERLKRFDRNQDGKLSQEELAMGYRREFTD